jgi:phage-related protein
MDDKQVAWMGSSKKDLLAMPEPVIKTFGYALDLAQNGSSYRYAKTLTQFKSAVVEVLEDHDSDTYRAVYTAQFADTVYVLHCFKKKSPRQSELPKRDRETIEARLKVVTAIEKDKHKDVKNDRGILHTSRHQRS